MIYRPSLGGDRYENEWQQVWALWMEGACACVCVDERGRAYWKECLPGVTEETVAGAGSDRHGKAGRLEDLGGVAPTVRPSPLPRMNFGSAEEVDGLVLTTLV